MSSTKHEPGFKTTPGSVCLVTGSSGLVGSRLVEMLLDRGAKQVLAMDVVEPNASLTARFSKYGSKVKVFSGGSGDLTNEEAVKKVFQYSSTDGQSSSSNIDVVYHIAALVGPFHDRDKYWAVNYDGTIHLLNACKEFNVPKFIFSSSPSTRFTGVDVEALREDQMEIPKKFLARYAESKAAAEVAVLQACNAPSFYTIAVAPHQVYGPHDSLFMPKLLETAGNNRLRIFGKGENKISITYNDNYCHGLMCGADALYEGSPALGKYYVVTDGNTPVLFWKALNEAIKEMGFVDLETKMHLPVWLLYSVAYVANMVGWLVRKKFKLNPFTVKMLVIHRYFCIDNAIRDLHYQPVVDGKEAWPSTIAWMKDNWLPGFLKAQQEEKDAKNKKKSQ